MLYFSNYEEYCKSFSYKNKEQEEVAVMLLCIKNYLLNILEFDNTVGTSVPFGFLEFIEKATIQSDFSEADKDELSHIILEFQSSFTYLIKNMHEKIVKENVVMPISKVRKINSESIKWLSKKSGKTIKEKVSSSGYKMLAVNRYNSLDVGENRLLKALLYELINRISMKLEYFPDNRVNDCEKELLQSIQKVIQSNALKDVGRWENISPNNALISDRYYKKAWKTWLMVNKLDDNIYNDSKNFSEYMAVTFFIKIATLMRKYAEFPQDLTKFNFQEFNFEKENQKIVGFIIPLFSSDKKENSKMEFDILDFIPCELSIISNKVTFEIDDVKTVIEFNNMKFNIESENNAFEGFNKTFGKKITPYNFDDFAIEFQNRLLYDIENKSLLNIFDEYYKANQIVIDIFSINPEFKADNLPTKKIVNKLIGFKVLQYGEVNYTPIGNSKILKKSENISVVSFSNIFENNNFDDASYLIKDMAKTFDTNNLIYILPDVFNEFQSVAMHKNIRMNFKNSFSFPKSISSIFSWQTTNLFEDFKANDFVIVADLINDKITFTLLQGKFKNELKQKFPKTKGIIWERYPTEIIDNETILNNLMGDLKNEFNNIDDAKWLLENIGFEGVTDNQQDLFIDLLDEWKHIEKGSVTNKNYTSNIDYDLKEFIEKRDVVIGKSKVHIILNSKNLECDEYECYYNLDIIDGYKSFQKYQKNVDFPMWRDYMPSLSIKQLYGKFELIKGMRIEPRIGKKYVVNIERTFTLPKGVKFYRFPLIIGDGIKEPQYEATLKSRAFPLDEDVECKLTMTYEYGTTDPYSLVFKPVDKTSFNQVKAEWVKIESNTYEVEDLPFPNFPAVKDWSNFKNYPKRGSRFETNDLLEWIERTLKEFDHNKYIEIDLNQYYVDWRISRVGKKHCEIYIAGVGAVLIFQPSNMELSSNDTIYTILEKGRHSRTYLFAINIRKKPYNPSTDINRERIIKSLFPFYVVFFNNRNIINEFPDNFAGNVIKGIVDLLYTYNTTTNKEIKSICLSFLILLRANVNENLCDIVMEHISENYEKTSKKAGIKDAKMWIICINNLETESEKLLLDKIFNLYKNDIKKDKKIITLLSTALWKNEKLIFNLDEEMLIDYFDKSIKLLNENLKKILKKGSVLFRDIREKNYMASYLEFILAVYRLRSKNVQSINEKISMNNPDVRKLYVILEKLSDILVERNIKLDTHVQVQVKRPEQYRAVSDLIYALLIYVTGKNIDEEIIISGIDDD